MGPAPTHIGWAKVIAFTAIDERHRHTGACRQIVVGALLGPAAGLAICRVEGEDSFYLFGCDERWGNVTDTCHPTLEEAMDQAEFEKWEGVTATWHTAPPNKSLQRTRLRRAAELGG